MVSGGPDPKLLTVPMTHISIFTCSLYLLWGLPQAQPACLTASRHLLCVPLPQTSAPHIISCCCGISGMFFPQSVTPQMTQPGVYPAGMDPSNTMLQHLPM